jgi:hypothetical protein
VAKYEPDKVVSVRVDRWQEMEAWPASIPLPSKGVRRRDFRLSEDLSLKLITVTRTTTKWKKKGSVVQDETDPVKRRCLVLGGSMVQFLVDGSFFIADVQLWNADDTQYSLGQLTVRTQLAVGTHRRVSFLAYRFIAFAGIARA